MATEYEGMNEQELRKLLDDAEEYDERAKIRSAIRNLKKASGGKRQTIGTSVYRRPGFQAPKLVQIPNSVTGNVLPSSLKDGESVKPPDKNTPTIGYLNATTTKSPKRKETTGTSPRSSQSTYSSQQDPAMKDQEGWWNKRSQSSSRSQTPSDTSEQRTYSSNRGESDQVFTTTEQQREPTPEPPREPTPEPPREPTPEPPREPTPEPPREPTPEPPREPTPEPPREPTPEPPRELTPEPSPEPITEQLPSPSPNEPTPDPSPEPPQEPSPEPLPEPSPDLVIESPADELECEQEDDIGKQDNEEEEQFSDEEDDELIALEVEDHSQLQLVNNSIPLDILQVVEPGLEENKDFRTKLRKTEDAVIDTKAAFPSQKKKAEQVDFRNVLKKTVGGPEKKSFKVEQVDFREKLKPKDSIKNDNEKEVSNTPDYKEVVQEQQQEVKRSNIDDGGLDKPEEKSVQSIVEEDSYEARKEARRREREKGLQEKTVTENVTNGAADDDSYEARREARRKAREEKKLKEQQGGTKPAMTYKEQQQIDQAKRMEENKKKWNSLDQSSANGTSEKPPIARQKSTGAQRGAQQLLAWCQHKTRYYENVEVKDFSNSFGNGLALCAILHTFVPDDIPYDDLSPDNPTENFGVALQVSEQIGIGSFFDVEDLVSVKAPDPKSMMTFLATIYQHFK